MYTREALAADIVNVLFLAGGGAPVAFLPELLRRVGRSPRPSTYRMALLRLRRDRKIRRKGMNERARWELTRRGMSAATLPPARTDSPPAPEGLHYFVTYDIPSSLDPVRDQFRAELIRHGWRRLHKSLWISEFDIRHTALEAADALGVAEYVFIGTGALARPPSRPTPPDKRKLMDEALSAAEREAGSRLPTAFQTWTRATTDLRQEGWNGRLEKPQRIRWKSTTRILGRALRV